MELNEFPDKIAEGETIIDQLKDVSACVLKLNPISIGRDPIKRKSTQHR